MFSHTIIPVLKVSILGSVSLLGFLEPSFAQSAVKDQVQLLKPYNNPPTVQEDPSQILEPVSFTKEKDTSETRFLDTLAAAQTDSDSIANPSSGEMPASQNNSQSGVSNNHLTPQNNSQTSATPDRRALPAPIDSPPFPSGEWQIGGTNPIGVPDTSSTYPLMKALSNTPLGEFLNKNRIKIYGWADVGANLSTSSKNNFPEAYTVYPNQVDLDQIAINIERIPDSVQKDHIDWGGRLTGFYGTDYRYTFGNGYFSDQFLKDNRKYGYDPLLFYGDLYIPKVVQGMNIRVGRFLSVPDIEAQLAPDNYMYTHSLMYTYDGYTQTGILASVKLNDNWTVQAGITDGNDTALWTHAAQPTGLAAFQWISNSTNDSLYVVANSFNKGNYTYNNIQEYAATWSHKFNSIVHTKIESWYMYEKHVPASTVPDGVFPLGDTSGFTNEWAIVNYLEFKLSKKDYISVRNEYMDDMQGQRTGYATSYSSHGIGWSHWFNDWLAFRPEVRYERSYQVAAYDDGRKKNQFTLAADIIVRY